MYKPQVKSFKQSHSESLFKKDTSNTLRVSLQHFFSFSGQKYFKIRKEKKMEMLLKKNQNMYSLISISILHYKRGKNNELMATEAQY